MLPFFFPPTRSKQKKKSKSSLGIGSKVTSRFKIHSKGEILPEGGCVIKEFEFVALNADLSAAMDV